MSQEPDLAERQREVRAVFVPDVGWIDLDPTNDQVVGERHITLGWGRDCRDVAPLVGVLYGSFPGQPLEVGVDVVPVEQR